MLSCFVFSHRDSQTILTSNSVTNCHWRRGQSKMGKLQSGLGWEMMQTLASASEQAYTMGWNTTLVHGYWAINYSQYSIYSFNENSLYILKELNLSYHFLSINFYILFLINLTENYFVYNKCTKFKYAF